jgi:hypothetical protein
VYANGAQDISDSVLGVQIINGTGVLLNFGGQVIKNVAGYDVARLLVGSKGQLAMVTQISFKVMPDTYVGKLNAAVKSFLLPLYDTLETCYSYYYLKKIVACNLEMSIDFQILHIVA